MTTLNDSAPHDLSPVPKFNANAGSSEAESDGVEFRALDEHVAES